MSSDPTKSPLSPDDLVIQLARIFMAQRQTLRKRLNDTEGTLFRVDMPEISDTGDTMNFGIVFPLLPEQFKGAADKEGGSTFAIRTHLKDDHADLEVVRSDMSTLRGTAAKKVIISQPSSLTLVKIAAGAFVRGQISRLPQAGQVFSGMCKTMTMSDLPASPGFVKPDVDAFIAAQALKP